MSDHHAFAAQRINYKEGMHLRRHRILIVAGLVIFITILHFWIELTKDYQHIIFRESYFIPLVLAGFWYGLRGALITSLSITILYSSFIFHSWQGFSAEDFNNIVAAVIGLLRTRERLRQKEKTEEIAALAGGLAHELNTPLFTAIGTIQLLQDEIESENPIFTDLQSILRNLKQIKNQVKRIAAIRQVEMKDYVNDTVILDIEKSKFDTQKSTLL